jgi:hypothetical protein
MQGAVAWQPERYYKSYEKSNENPVKTFLISKIIVLILISTWFVNFNKT